MFSRESAGILLILVSIPFLSGCTLRYSKELSDWVPESSAANHRRVTIDSSGLEVFFVQVVDVESAASLLKTLGEVDNCKSLRNVEVDYQSYVLVVVDLPQILVSADCESKATTLKAPKRKLPTAAMPEVGAPNAGPPPSGPGTEAPPIQLPPIAPGR